MNSLRNKILQQYETFNASEPSEGHFERFSKKLGPTEAVKKRGIPDYLKIAAIVVGVSFLSIFNDQI